MALALASVMITAGAGLGIWASRTAGAVTPATTFSADNPPHGIGPGPDQAISDFLLTEPAAGSLPTGTAVCFQLDSPAGVSFVGSASAPVVTAAGGGAAASSPATAASPTIETFTVSAASSGAPAAFTVSGLALAAPAPAAGQVKGHSGVFQPATDTMPATCGSEFGGGVVTTAVVTANRLAGADRYSTAAAIFGADNGCASGGSAGTGPGRAAVIARGDQYPDALAGAYLAGAHHTGILLTAPGTLPPATVSALRDDGVGTVYLLGGNDAISPAVEAQLTATSATACNPATGVADRTSTAITVVRIKGLTRYDTAAAIAAAPGPSQVGTLAPPTGSSPMPTAIVSTGVAFPDALSGGPMAWRGLAASGATGNGNGNGFPLLLTDPAVLSPQAQGALTQLGIRQVLIPGGSSAVSPAVEGQIKGMGIAVRRFGGADRTDTSRLVAAFETAPVGTGLGYSTAVVDVARGDEFADALAGGPHGGAHAAPLVVSENPGGLGPYVTTFLQALANTQGTSSVDLLGGLAAISFGLTQSIMDALTGTAAVAGPTGYDISFPQCGAAYPASPAFGIVGVNDGVPYSQNPCLASEYAWASAAPVAPAFYVNISDPGSGAPQWNHGGPRSCGGSSDDIGCAYDFGWTAADQSLTYAVDQTGSPAPHRWWLDVETANTWSPNTAANTAVIHGALDRLTGAAAVTAAGVYSTRYQWNIITGTPSGLQAVPDWVPGASSSAEAATYCAQSFTGGPVLLFQYPAHGYDGDSVCT